MLGRVLGLDRQEGAGADVQGQHLAGDASFVERGDHPVGEVQGRGRRGNRPLLTREHRLVIAAVGLVGGALASDIRRQRHATGALEQ
jgi:hypothetical protein